MARFGAAPSLHILSSVAVGLIVATLLMFAFFTISRLPEHHAKWLRFFALAAGTITVVAVLVYWSEIWMVTGLPIDWLD